MQDRVLRLTGENGLAAADGRRAGTRGDASAPTGSDDSATDALWERLIHGSPAEWTLEDWIALLAAEIGAQRAALMIGPPDSGPYRLSAMHPSSRVVPEAMAVAADLAISERREIVKSGLAHDQSGRGACVVACPVMIDGALRGVVSVLLRVTAELDLRAVIRRIHWALPWVEARLHEGAAREQQATATALELIAAALEEGRFARAAAAAAAAMADRLGCDRVTVGVRRRLRSRIVAVSDSPDFARKAGPMRAIADAMDEAVDQERTILHPLDGEDPLLITFAHAELHLRARERMILTVPMLVGSSPVGAVTFERSQSFDAATVRLAEVTVGVLGPILHEKQQNDRPLPLRLAESAGGLAAWALGPRHLGAKLVALLLVALSAVAAMTEAPLRITADARVEGAVRRIIAAPFAGYVETAAIKAGDSVAKGDLLAALDDREMRLELLRWQTLRDQRRREYERAFSERDRATSGIVSAQLAQAEAEIALLEERLARTRLTAPFDGVVLAGDLDQSVGAAVERGQVLFEIAPADAYRVTLLVDERDLAEIETGQRGQLVLAALPGLAFHIAVGRVTAVAEVDDGLNVFRVQAKLEGDAARLRPGMEGVAKVAVGERSLAAIWTRGIRDWLRLALWRWRP